MTSERGIPAPTTRQEALEQALQWGRTLSHHNLMLGTEGDYNDRPRTLVAIVQADAAEVQRLAALWTMLPDAEPDGTSITVERIGGGS